VKSRALEEFLKKARIAFTVFQHPEGFTAQHEAALSHIPGRSWAKTVVCVAGEEPILAVVPAHLRVDLEVLRMLAGASTMRLASEDEFAGEWPDCEPGATLPFVTRRTLRVFVDQSFVGEPEMTFTAGTHTAAIRMHYWDFVELTQPTVGRFAGGSNLAVAVI
jgi:Ala-tRNA(Pro) deacylase